MIRAAALTIALAASAFPASAAEGGRPRLAAASEPPSWDQAAQAFTDAMTAEGRVVVRLGERVVVRLDAELRPHVESVGPSSGPAYSVQQSVPEGAVAFSLGADPQAGLVLKAENGLSTPLAYGALIVVGAGENIGIAPTSICTVPSHVVGLEMWRDPVLMIALGPFSPRKGEAVVCETLAPPPGRAAPAPEPTAQKPAGTHGSNILRLRRLLALTS
jgi:hypothetical protein